MSPEEKVKDLYDKYEKMYPLYSTKAGENFHKSDIIKCTLIVIDELIKETSFEVPNIRQSYWQEVKKEIEKL